MIDWDLAISTGVRFAKQGPQVSLADARAVVAELRGQGVTVTDPVPVGTGRQSFLDDPAGNRVELQEPAH